MPLPEGYVKAELAIEGGDTIRCLFNPTEYTITKTNNWTFDKVKGRALPAPKFGGGNPREMSVSLLLDQSLPNAGKSVKDITDKLFKMMETPTGGGGGNPKSAPPFVTFQWGEMIPFRAVCTSLTVAFQLFKANGTPIRADVKLQLKQADKASTASSNSAAKPTNPTTRSAGGLGVHVVKDGDSLQAVAYRAYGDPARWRQIAEANAIDNPLHLRRGTALNLPRLDG